MKITRITGREIYDSRGWPTVQCELVLENGYTVYANVPSGASVGSHEAIELRDGGTRLGGRGVHKAIQNLEEILAPQFIGLEPNGIEGDLRIIEIDATPNKAFLGANTTLALSMALYRAQAFAESMELYELIAYAMGSETVTIPYPLLNVINGGAHASNTLRIQEFLIIPVGSFNFRAGFEAAVTVYHELSDILKTHGYSTAVGDEGGFAPKCASDLEALDLLFQALEQVNSKHTLTCVMGIDVAATQFYDPTTGLYTWHDKQLNHDDLIEFYQELLARYPLYSIEDGLSEDDWQGWRKLTAALGTKVQLVGDDLFVTNTERIAQGVHEKAANSVIIKPNQCGTVTEALQAIKFCKEQNLHTIVSHRSGDTEDNFIADLAVGASAGQIKAGACCRSEHLSKYNRLLAIEDILSLTLLEA